VGRRDAFCPSCGVSVDGRGGSFELVLPDDSRVPVTEVLTLGRGEGNTVRLTDRSVSRRHARLVAGAGAPILEDVGSSHGTFLDGARVRGRALLHAGATLRLGDPGIELQLVAIGD
jgi:pSer/pThr/pTyr-binding forkhead associated (FHA) protein